VSMRGRAFQRTAYAIPEPRHQSQQLFKRHCHLYSSQIRYVGFGSAAGWCRDLRKHSLARSGTLGFLGPPLRVVLCVGFRDLILRLFADSILVRPLFRASTVARRNQLYRRRN
jgi:hypothetical protein